MWGLFILFHLTDRYNLTRQRQFKVKALILKVIVVFVNVQTLVIDICAAQGAIGCNKQMSAVAFGAVYKDICTMVESFFLGNAVFFLTVSDPRFRTTAEANEERIAAEAAAAAATATCNHDESHSDLSSVGSSDDDKDKPPITNQPNGTAKAVGAATAETNV